MPLRGRPDRRINKAISSVTEPVFLGAKPPHSTFGFGDASNIFRSNVVSRGISTSDRNTPFGHLDKALDAAVLNKWVVVDMKNDWKRIFVFE